MLVVHPVLGTVNVPDEYKSRADIENYLISKEAERRNEAGEGKGSLETFTSQFGEGFASSLRGVAQKLEDVTGGFVKDTKSYEDEFQSRVDLAQNPVAGYTGLIIGSVFDPVTLPTLALKPLTIANSVTKTMALRGSAQGAFGGLLEPTYEQFGDSTALNVGAGGVVGGGLGAGLGRLGVKLGALSETEKAERKAAEQAADEAAQAEAKRIRLQEEETRRVIKEVYDDVDLDAEMPTRDFLPDAEAERLSIEDIRAELNAEAANVLPSKEAAELTNSIASLEKQLDESIKRLENAKKFGAGGTKKQRQQSAPFIQKLEDDVKDLQLSRDRLYQQRDTHVKGLAAKTELGRLGAGKPSARYKARIDADKKANAEARQQYKERLKSVSNPPKAPRIDLEVGKVADEGGLPVVTMTKHTDLPLRSSKVGDNTYKFVELPDSRKIVLEINGERHTPDGVKVLRDGRGVAEVKEKLQPTATQGEDGIRVATPKKPVSEAVAPGRAGEIPLGIQPRGTSAGSMEAKPSAVYAPEATEGIDEAALQKSVFTTKLDVPEEDLVRDQGFAMTYNERQREAMRKVASTEQLKQLSSDPEFAGKFDYASIERTATKLRSEIGEDYDSLVDFLMTRVEATKAGEGILNAAELEILRPLFDAAQDGIRDTMRKMRNLNRAGNLDSPEGLEAIQDLQFYNYINNINLDNRAKASATLRQYKRMKNIRKLQNEYTKKGKPVSEVFAEIKC